MDGSGQKAVSAGRPDACETMSTNGNEVPTSQGRAGSGVAKFVEIICVNGGSESDPYPARNHAYAPTIVLLVRRVFLPSHDRHRYVLA